MPHVENFVVIHAPIEHVYTYASDIMRMPEWCAIVTAARWIIRPPPLSAARAEVVCMIAGQPIPTQVIVLKDEPPRQFVMRGIAGVQATFAWKLQPHANGTHAARTIDWALPPSALGRALDALYHGQALAQALERVKQAVERQGDSHP